MPETFDILTAIKSTYPSIHRDFRRSFPKADAQEVDNLIGRFFWDTMMRPEKNTDPQAREKFLGNLAQSPQIPAEWKADNFTFIKNVTQEAFRFTPKATYAEQRGEGVFEKFAKPAREAREAALLKASESYEIKGTREEVLHQAKIARLEKPTAREQLATELSGAAEVLRNVFGQHMVAPAAAVAAQAGVPGAEQVAIAATPRVHFATEITKKYGPWAAIPYTIAEVLFPFAAMGKGFAFTLGAASRFPGVAGRAAKFTLTHPTLQNAVFLGGHSGADCVYQKRQMGEKPTIGEFLVHSGAGTAIGVAMPHVQKVFRNVALRKEFNENVEMLLGKKIAQLRRMPEPKLRELIRESHLPKSVREKAPSELLEKLKLPENLVVKRIKGLNRRGAVAQFLGQSLRAGAVGGGVQIGTDVALGLPVNLQNVAHNAAMMMGFHASGLISHASKAMKPKDGIADLSTPQGKGIVGRSIKFLLKSPDASPEQMQAKFVENLKKNKVDVIRTVDGEILSPKEIFTELNKVTEPSSQSMFDHLALAYREYGKAMITVPQAELFEGLGRLEVRTVMRSRIDNLIASVGRRLGESTDVPSTANDFKMTALRTNEDWYELKLKKIAEEFGQEGVDVVVESLRTGTKLRDMKEPVAQDIMNRHPMMRSVIDNFREAMSKPVSEKETQQQMMKLRAQEEVTPAKKTREEVVSREKPSVKEFEITDEMRQRVAKDWGEKQAQNDAFVRLRMEPIESKEHYIKLSEDFWPEYREGLARDVGEKGYIRLHEVKKGKDTYILEDMGGEKYNVFKVGFGAGKKFHDALEPMSSYTAAEVESVLGIKVPKKVEAVAEKVAEAPKTPEEIEQAERIAAFQKQMAEQAAAEKPAPPTEKKPPAKPSQKPKAPEKPLQPEWEPEASFFQRQAIEMLRERIKRPEHWKKLKGAFRLAKKRFKGSRGKMRPTEIAEAERLLGIEKWKREKLRPPGKPKSDPAEIVEKVEEIDVTLSERGIEEAERLYNKLNDLLSRKQMDMRTKGAKQAIDRLIDVSRKLSKEIENDEIHSFLAREHQKIGSAVEYLGETGIIAKRLKEGDYLVYFPIEDAVYRVHWTDAQPSNLREAIKLSASFDRFKKAGKEAGMTNAEIETFISTVEGNGRIGIVIGVDPSELIRLAGRAASKVKELFRRKPSSVNDLASSVELYRYRRYQRRYGSVFGRFFQFAFFGDPMKDATRKQARDIENAIEQNETNPFMGAEPHLIDPTDFMVKVLNRTNWSRIMAKEGGQSYQPMNRIDAQRILKEFAKISGAIRNKNFALASNFGLPLAISESTPRTRKAFEGMTIATAKRDSRMADLYELANDINVVADRKARKFINPKTGGNLDREVADNLQGFVRPNDPNLMHESRQIAELVRKSRFREKFWDILNNVHNFRTLPKLRGSLTHDRNKFIDFWVERGLNSEKVTPENAEATRNKLESEAGRIFDNPDKRKEIIDNIIEENKLGKIVDKKGMNLYYPGYAKKLTEALREKAQRLEEGGYVKGGYGGIVFEHARKLTLEERQAHPELYKEPNVVDDFMTYGLDVLSLAYRADMDFIMWRVAKEIKLDMEAAPKYARRFAHDLEFIESLRDRVLNPPRNIGRRISGNIAALTSAAILPGLRTVFRNLTGGTGMTYVWSGSKAMAGAWGAIRSGKYRGYSVPKIVKILGAEHQELIEGGIAKVKTKPTEVMPKGFSEEMSRWAGAVTQYSLTRVMPLVPDIWPWFAQVTKRMTFAGSEGILRPTAGMAGFISTYEAVLSEGAKYQRNVRIFGNSVDELSRSAKKKHGEAISDDFIRNRLKATRSLKAQNKYFLDLNVKENDRQLNQRAFREALKGARETIMWTQFLYGAINTPKLMAHPLGRVILVLRKYTWNKAMVGLRVMRELPPSKGGGSEEWARFMRYVGVVGISTALSKVLHIGIGRYFADDFLEMLGSVKAMMEGVDPDEAFWGKSWKIWLAGAAIGRNMDILAHSQGDRAGSEMNKYLEAMLANSPYGKPIIDAWREYVKVTEHGKNVFEALANNLIGLMREYKK